MPPRTPRPAPRPRRDPLTSPADRLAPAGTPFEPHAPLRERGVVVAADARRDAYQVRTNSGRVLTVGRGRSSLGDHDRLPVGTPVRVDHGLGAPYIDLILPPETADAPRDNPVSVTDTAGHGGEDPVLDRNMRVGGRAAGEPTDVLPGDFVRTSPDGAAVGALHGKVALLKGSPLAQVRAYGETDTLELVAGLLRLVTWMGEARVVNDDGRVSFQFRGGSDQTTETGPDEERYTIHFDLGHTGDVLDFRITTPQGQTLFRVHVDAEGRLSTYARGGVAQEGGGTRAPVRVAGDHEVEVGGTQTTRVGGSRREEVQASRTSEVSQDDARVCGQDAVDRIGRDRDASVGGRDSLRVEGDAETRVTRGAYRVRADAGDVELAAQGGAMRLRTGARDIDVTPGARLRVRTAREGGVELGTDPDTEAVRHRELAAALNALRDDYVRFKAAVISHVHAGSSPSPQLLPPAVAPGFAWDLGAARSRVVRLR